VKSIQRCAASTVAGTHACASVQAAPEHVARKAKALPWLVRAIQVSRVAGATAADARRAKAHESEEVCLAASELLAVVLAGSDWACTSLGDASNVDALLVAAARWRKKEPASSLESEWCVTLGLRARFRGLICEKGARTCGTRWRWSCAQERMACSASSRASSSRSR